MADKKKTASNKNAKANKKAAASKSKIKKGTAVPKPASKQQSKPKKGTKKTRSKPEETKPISKTAYAKHRKEQKLKGITRQAVDKAISTARLLKCVVTVGKKTMITSAEEADKEWAAKTTPDNQDPSSPQQTQEEIKFDNEQRETSKTYTNARASRLAAQAELAEIELARARGSVLDLNIARREITTIGNELIQGLTNITRAKSIELADETNPQIMRVKLQELHKGLIDAAMIKLKRLIPNE